MSERPQSKRPSVRTLRRRVASTVPKGAETMQSVRSARAQGKRKAYYNPLLEAKDDLSSLLEALQFLDKRLRTYEPREGVNTSEQLESLGEQIERIKTHIKNLEQKISTGQPSPKSSAIMRGGRRTSKAKKNNKAKKTRKVKRNSRKNRK